MYSNSDEMSEPFFAMTTAVAVLDVGLAASVDTSL